MTKPSASDFLAAADAAYSQDPSTSGLGLLTGRNGGPVAATKAADGFHAVALETGSGQVILSFEGTALGSLATRPTFVQAQLAGDAAIAQGQDPAAYADALRFVQRATAAAESQGIAASDIFVAGHSSGGAVAEYVAVKTGLGGTTFGAPGIPAADINTGLPSHLTNYVDYGDPVGNYSDNPDRVGNLLLGEGIERYGRATYVGQPSDAVPLAAAGRLFGTSRFGTAAAVGILAKGIADHHLLADYAADLGTTLPAGGADAGASLSAADVEAAVATVLGGSINSGAGQGIGSIGAQLNEIAQEASGAASGAASTIGQWIGKVPHPVAHFG